MLLYQKHRSKTFDEIIGHEKIVKELTSKITKGKLPNVVYFSGQSGTGKTSFAYLIAKMANCENPQGYNPCNECPSCQDVNQETWSLGTRYLNGSYLDTESVRAIEPIINQKSIVSKNTTIIIDEIQELHNNKKALKALLPLLEKVNDDVFFILLSMDDAKVDTAVKSRGLQYKLKTPDFGMVGECLNRICEKEGIKVDEQKADALLTIGEYCGGSLRSAINILERVIDGDSWKEEDVTQVIGAITKDEAVGFIAKLVNKDVSCLKFDLSEEALIRIRFTLRMYLKFLIDSKSLNRWEYSQIADLKKAALSKNVATAILETLYFKDYNHTSKDVVEFELLKLMSMVGQA